MEKALFGAGCFWGVQFYFDQVPGVVKTVVGYSGGHKNNPSYEDVCTHETGHAEVVLVEFDTTKISYTTLLKHFFKIHDPTQLNRQGPDIGDNYRSVIFYFNEDQKKTAEAEKNIQGTNFTSPVVTEISKAGDFFEAEDYHQKYAERTGRGMCHISYQPIS